MCVSAIIIKMYKSDWIFQTWNAANGLSPLCCSKKVQITAEVLCFTHHINNQRFGGAVSNTDRLEI